MGKVYIMEDTCIDPITTIGKMSGVCYGSDIISKQKNYQRGLDNLISGHWRTLEFVQVYLVIDGYSARVIRELYTHIGGDPTRLQASTRYIDYSNFNFITPPSINTDEKKEIYNKIMSDISDSCNKLKELGVPREDIANLLPLGMETKVVMRTNLRQLIDMSHQRLCNRAYWEFRELMKDIMNSLSCLSEEWSYIVSTYFIPKCEFLGECTETKPCKKH